MAALFPLCVLFFSVLLPSAVRGCAFPPEGCSEKVCRNYKTLNYRDILNKDSFNVDDKSVKGDWSPTYMKDLGYFFSAYNPLYNGGKYDSTRCAVKDGAPALNWFTLRSTRGEYHEEYSTMSECCSGCANLVNCKYFIFVPYYDDTYDDNDNIISRDMDANGEGECYMVIRGKYTYPWLEKNCVSIMPNKTSWFDPSFPAAFYGGICNPDVNDDPHFVGARGTRFDWNGQLDKPFCLVTDSRLQINTMIRGYMDPRAREAEKSIRSWMKELGFVWLDDQGARHALHLVARSGKEQERGTGFLVGVVLDGVIAAVPSEAGAVLGQGDLTLEFAGVSTRGPYDIENYRLKIGDILDVSLSLRVAHPLLQTPDDAEVHFNLIFNSFQATEQVHGVLGQTYRSTPMQRLKAVKYSILSQVLGGPVQADGRSGRGFLDGTVSDYETSSILSTDCKYASMS